MGSFLQDLRFGARLLRKDKGFTLTATLTLAICLGANAAIFSIVNSVVLRPLPFPDADRILFFYNSYPRAGAERSSTGVPDYYDRLRDMNVMAEQSLVSGRGQTISGHGDAERVSGLQVTPSFFRLLRVQPYRGRVFSEDEGEIGREKKVVVSYALWQRMFAGRDDAVGRDIRLNGEPHTIVGVLPRGFQFVQADVQLWTPLAFTNEQKSDDARHNNSWAMIGRLKPGATLEQAQQQVDAINRRNLDRFPEFKEILVNAGFQTRVVRLQEDLVREVRRPLILLWAGVLFVLLIGCVNIANLVLVRSIGRAKEMATRHALGAGRARLARQLLTETTLLALAGGALGLLLGYWALRLVWTLGLERLPRSGEIRLDEAASFFTFGLALVVGVVLGLVPIASTRRARLNQALREEGRSGTSARGTRVVGRLLVTAQVAIALTLLVGAGLLFASFRHVLAVDPGFRPAGVLTGMVNPPATRYAGDPELRTFVQRALERIRSLPGVEGAAVTSSIPFGTSFSDSVILAEGYVMQPGESLVSPSRIVASAGYFEAMGIPLVRGRLFGEQDTERSRRVVIVDERLARKFWPNADPIGKRMFYPDNPKSLLAPPTDQSQFFTVIGVVGPVKLQRLVVAGSGEPVGAYYFPFLQRPFRNITFAIKTRTDPASLVPAVRRDLTGIDAELPFYEVRTLTERMDLSLANRRAPTMLAMAFAAVALLLAAVGIYGVLAHQVTLRTREVGIRMALGSDRASIFRLVIREGLLTVGTGMLLGLAGALASGRALETQLYGVRPADPPVLFLVALVLGLVSLAACVIPARRAAKTDPVVALTEL